MRTLDESLESESFMLDWKGSGLLDWKKDFPLEITQKYTPLTTVRAHHTQVSKEQADSKFKEVLKKKHPYEAYFKKV